MDSLASYGSDDENEYDRYGSNHTAMVSSGGSGTKKREDDTNYDDVNMDMSEDSQGESEPELPPAQPSSSKRDERRRISNDSRERDRDRDQKRRDESSPRRSEREKSDRDRADRDRSDRDRDRDRSDRERPDRRSPRRDDRYRAERSDRGRSSHDSGSRRGLLGDKPDDKPEVKVPSLLDVKPFSDIRDAVSPRFTDRDRRDNRERERDRDRQSRRSEERRSHRRDERDRDRSRERPRGAAYPPPSSMNDRRGGSPSGDYRPSSYKVNKKLEVMEKMGLQIKTPDGSMATAQQLRSAAGGALPAYGAGARASRVMDQVQKRKLLWAHKNKSETEEAGKWTGTRFAQDNDGKQKSKFMRLMGIKDQAAAPEAPDKEVDPIKKQEELFQAMQAQYEVARATTHTMRGVGLGFQRGQF